MVRRAVALGLGVLVLILLAVAVNGCLNARKERALKDYNREVATIVEESDTLVSEPFFELLGQTDAEGFDLEAEVNQLRAAAEEQVKRAEGLDTPDEMKPAQRNLLLALGLRAGALERIASKLPTALGDEGSEQAVEEIAGQMQAFLASDVVYSQRVVPLIDDALKEADVGEQEIKVSTFLDDLDWLEPSTVADALDVRAPRTGSRGEPAPGLHGHGLVSVAVGNTTLQPNAVNRVPAGADVAFAVKFANQGENDEFDVRVNVEVSGSGRPIRASRTVEQTRKGAEATVSVPLGSAPPVGTSVTVEVTVARVPGEEKTDNNTQRYTVLFQR